MGLMDKLKEQELIDPKLIIALVAVLVVGAGVLIWVNSGGSDNIAETEHTYYCHFDDAKRNVTNEEFYDLRKTQDAIINDRDTGCPQRVRCPECNRMSCFKLDRETGEEIEVQESWDLSETAVEPTRGGPR